ncbi:hypothetical protein [Bacillus sp. V5-8f]|uniref:hypothetical protein n=1 Tax=Bacillus sp. V5-8f TaxID=2053044 RepID=UPI000C78B72D|nr:hypothetical protein [Bacillus sp. V5-8f]PLT33384.1 hypothetical protein CUU64_13900 [Bacillus sp. V5-8f]
MAARRRKYLKRKNKAESPEDRAVNVESLSTNRHQNPDIGSGGRGPVILDDQNATILNEGIFDNTNREYFDRDLYR